MSKDKGFGGFLKRYFKDGSEEKFSEDDVMSMLESGQESGEIKEEGLKMIDSVFDFDDKLAYEIMTPRTDVFTIDVEDPINEYIDELMELKYSRIPVYRDDVDNIIGILHIKDFFFKAWKHGFDNVIIERILRKPYFVPETKNIDSLFYDMKKTKQYMAILIDEYGGFSGICTMEDIIEEIVGDIEDEFDEEETDLYKLGDGRYEISGDMSLDDLNDELELGIDSENIETVGGLVLEHLGELPEDDKARGLSVTIENYKFTIEEFHDRRVEKVLLEITDEAHKGELEGDEQR